MNMVIRGGVTAGACVAAGCAVYPTINSCIANATCKWYQPSQLSSGTCIARSCGYHTGADCVADPACSWVPVGLSYACVANPCVSMSTASDCLTASPSCTFSGAVCAYTRCGSGIPGSVCMGDTSCLLVAGTCMNPMCSKYTTASACTADPRCTYTYTPPAGLMECVTSQCFSRTTSVTCAPPGERICTWDASAGVCRQLSFIQANSPSIQSCPTIQSDAKPVVVYVLVAIAAVLLGLILWRLYLAIAKGQNFLFWNRNNTRFSQKMYASDVIDEAARRDVAEGNPNDTLAERRTNTGPIDDAANINSRMTDQPEDDL